ncbi:MAG: 50S ribosomal protein L11 methyltransferase [Actinomycetota bacterium]|nr:50S ribosomal protein L11 methyltransferase [Actinomycetota bacterium]
MTRDTTLAEADGVSIVRTNAGFRVGLGGRQLYGCRYTLPILDVFSSPQSLERGLEKLEQRIQGTAVLIEIVRHVMELYHVGALAEPSAANAVTRSHEKRFDSAPVHIRMLNDIERTSCFQSAIRNMVKPDDVVLDIGSGTGVLAVTAAMAGARHVYAVEATAMSRVAQRIVESNGVGKRVTVIEAHSLDVELPEKADLLVGEIIGDDPLGERIVPIFADARLRLLAAGARVIPSHVRVFALPLEVPPDSLGTFRFTETQAVAWRESYGLDFGALTSTSKEHDQFGHVNSNAVRGWKRLARPILVEDLDLFRAEPGSRDRCVTFRATEQGSISAMLLFFEAQLAPGIRLSLHPDDATPTNSWGNLLQLFARPLDVAPGQELRLRYRHDERGSTMQLEHSDG